MRRSQSHALRTAALTCLLGLCFLGQDNLGSNEAGKLALALQQVNPLWNPNDWYLSIPQHYQWLFQQIAGQLLNLYGITWGSLAVRLLGYVAWSWAIADLCLELGLNLAISLGATAIFLINQSMIAGEWVIGSGEPKTFAYACLIMAFLAWIRERQVLSGWWSGIACSFHILVGGYGSLALAVAATFKRQQWNLSTLARTLLAFGLGLLPVLLFLFPEFIQGSPTTVHVNEGPNQLDDASVSATWIYSYLRNPHHVIPGSWSLQGWLSMGTVLTLFGIASRLTLFDRGPYGVTRRGLALWASLTLIPFAAGLCVSPIDHEGAWLRFYPFRVADTLIPLATILLAAGELQARVRRSTTFLAIALSVMIAVQQSATWIPGWPARLGRGFPPNAEKESLYAWIRANTNNQSTVLAPPAGFESLPLLTGCAGVAQFKQIPNHSPDVSEWLRRMQDLGGDTKFWQRSRGLKTRKILSSGYDKLGPNALEKLRVHYNADLIITNSGQATPSNWVELKSTPSWSLWTNRI